jgi:hypothetical protein
LLALKEKQNEKVEPYFCLARDGGFIELGTNQESADVG